MWILSQFNFVSPKCLLPYDRHNNFSAISNHFVLKKIVVKIEHVISRMGRKLRSEKILMFKTL